jgi:uncharacterized membrane protein
MDSLAQSISLTPLSLWIQSTLWVVPWVQTIHIIAIGLLLSSVFMIDMRILNLTGRGQSIAETARRFSPWVWIGFTILLVSGTILVIGEPVRSLLNVFFWTKMGLLAVALISVAFFQVTLRTHPEMWEETHARRTLTKVLAVAALVVWLGIIFAGRFIAYVENFFPPAY